MNKFRFLLVIAAVGVFIPSAFSDTVSLGKIQFLVDTNVKMFAFKGEAGQVQSKVDRAGAVLKDLELTIPVSSLKTGMDLRDKHMRERVFTTADGKVPDIVFKAGQAKCAPDCVINGTLTIRGQTRPEQIHVSLSDPNHVRGSAKILLSNFGIADPEQLGVKVSDAVNVSFDLDLK